MVIAFLSMKHFYAVGIYAKDSFLSFSPVNAAKINGKFVVSQI